MWPIFILSLEGEDARRAPLLAKLDQLGLKYTVMLGVDGRKGLPPEYEAHVDRAAAAKRYRRNLTNGEFACSLSHRNIYQHVLDNGFDGAVVLEDDAIIDDRIKTFMDMGDYLAHDLMLLDYAKTYAYPHQAKHLKSLSSVVMPIAVSPCLTTGYSFNRNAAQQFIKASTPVSTVADWPCDLADMDAAIVFPRIVGHPEEGNGISHLHQERKLNQKDTGGKSLARYFTSCYWRERYRRVACTKICPANDRRYAEIYHKVLGHDLPST